MKTTAQKVPVLFFYASNSQFGWQPPFLIQLESAKKADSISNKKINITLPEQKIEFCRALFNLDIPIDVGPSNFFRLNH